jgi:hypothetical protein
MRIGIATLYTLSIQTTPMGFVMFRSTLSSAIAIFALFTAPMGFASEIYKCVSSDGSVTFADLPCSKDPTEVTIVEETNSRITSYESSYPNRRAYQPSVQPQPPRTNDHRTSGNGANRYDQIEPDYIEIPDTPVRPDTTFWRTTSGTSVIRTGEKTAIDPSTGRQIRVRPLSSNDEWTRHRKAKEDYQNALDAEQHQARIERRPANPKLCASYRREIAKLESREGARPSNRASRESRNKFYEHRKKNRERMKELKSLNSRYCR